MEIKNFFKKLTNNISRKKKGKLTKSKLSREIDSFQNLWRGGTTPSKYGWEKAAKIALDSGSHDMYKISELCLEPYSKNATIWDLGTNGGAWTCRMKKASKIICSDILPAKHTGFYRNIPKDIKHKVFFHKVTDFKCSFLEENSIDLLFSYDVFCHISYSGAKAYIENMKSKLKKGANCFIMIADEIKYQDPSGRDKLMKYAGFNSWEEFVKDYDGEPNKGRWYFYGVERFYELLEKNGYKIIDKDVIREYDSRSSIVHFQNT